MFIILQVAILSLVSSLFMIYWQRRRTKVMLPLAVGNKWDYDLFYYDNDGNTTHTGVYSEYVISKKELKGNIYYIIRDDYGETGYRNIDANTVEAIQALNLSGYDNHEDPKIELQYTNKVRQEIMHNITFVVPGQPSRKGWAYSITYPGIFKFGRYKCCLKIVQSVYDPDKVLQEQAIIFWARGIGRLIRMVYRREKKSGKLVLIQKEILKSFIGNQD